MAKYQKLSLQNQRLILHPERALFWGESKMLIVADPHFGKSQVLRDNGIPVPGGTTAGDLERLSKLLDEFHCRKLLFLGDLTHGRINNPVIYNRLIEQWRRRHMEIEISLVTGNHDRYAGRLPLQFQIDRVADEIIIEPFHFTHQLRRNHSRYSIAGHLHPAVTLMGTGRQQETIPCFCFGSRTAVMPAFGAFTGSHVIHPQSDDRIFVVAGENVIEVANGDPVSLP